MKCKLYIGVFILLVLLGYYKFLFPLGLEDDKWLTSLGVPVGLSFITFGSISYLTDIAKKRTSAGSILDCAFYTMFFPKLVSGPIITWEEFNKEKNQAIFDDVYEGITQIIYGLSEKILIADQLYLTMSSVEERFSFGVDIPTMLLFILAYCFQLYFDFSGYSNVALGICRMFGYHFGDNFNYPYKSTSVSEFWRRWHISLGSWFRKYVYIPMGGNRKNVYFNLMFVFLLTGLWHGNNIYYIVWGLLQGVMICLERKWKGHFIFPKWISHIYLLTIAYISWAIFKLGEISTVTITGSPLYSWKYFLRPRFVFLLVVASILSFVDIRKVLEKKKNIQYIFLLVLFILSIITCVSVGYSPYQYFRF